MKYKLNPWDHQLKIINTINDSNLDFYGLFLDMGCGKTKVALEILRQKCIELARVPKTLIIGPSAVQDNWKREIQIHTYINPNLVQVIDGTTKKDGKILKNPNKTLKLKQVSDESKQIFICTTATVKNLKQYRLDKKTKKKIRVDLESEVWHQIGKLGIEFIIVDESHHFKDPTGSRVKGLHKLIGQPQLKYKFILTGSPVLQDALDLWSQFYILDPMILGPNYMTFRSQYFYDKNAHMPQQIHFPDWVPKDEKYFNSLREVGVPEEEIERMQLGNLNNLIYKHACRVMKRDVLDLPERTYQTLEVGMDPKHKKMYNEFRDNLVTLLDNKSKPIKAELERILENDLDLKENIPDIMSADLAIVKTLRLMQLVCGIFTNDDGEVTLIPTERLKLLKETLQTITANKENKVVIWTVFTPTYGQIAELCKELKIRYVFLNGTQSKDEKQKAMDQFQNDPEVGAIIANPSAGGTGCNLTSGNYEVDYSRSFKLGDWLQKDARVDRGGQKRTTTSITLKTLDTIDSRCVERLHEKAQHAEDILARKDFSREEILGMI